MRENLKFITVKQHVFFIFPLLMLCVPFNVAAPVCLCVVCTFFFVYSLVLVVAAAAFLSLVWHFVALSGFNLGGELLSHSTIILRCPFT